jgi:RNA polymerase sigma-70 factor (ECF subfamily)
MNDFKLKYGTSELNRFANKEWNKILSFLQNRYGLSEDDCKDVFQEAFIILYENIKSGKLTVLTSSLSTYFISICRNKALESLRSSSKFVAEDDELSISLMSGEIRQDKLESLLSLEDDDIIERQKEDLVRVIVKNLPSPCNELLWGFYRDNLSIKTLADMYNYSEGSAKVTKHRCCEKFRIRYNELCQKLF